MMANSLGDSFAVGPLEEPYDPDRGGWVGICGGHAVLDGQQ